MVPFPECRHSQEENRSDAGRKRRPYPSYIQTFNQYKSQREITTSCRGASQLVRSWPALPGPTSVALAGMDHSALLILPANWTPRCCFLEKRRRWNHGSLPRSRAKSVIVNESRCPRMFCKAESVDMQSSQTSRRFSRQLKSACVESLPEPAQVEV